MVKEILLFADVPEDKFDKFLEDIKKDSEIKELSKFGRLGNYGDVISHYPATGLFTPLEGSDPICGQLGRTETVLYRRFITFCDPDYKVEAIQYLAGLISYEHPVVGGFEVEIFFPTDEQRKAKHGFKP